MENYEAFAYFLMRVSFGAVVLTHGIPKLLGIPHGSIENPMASTTHLIGQVLGLPFAEPMAYFVMLLETLGAVMIIVGCSTRAAATLVNQVRRPLQARSGSPATSTSTLLRKPSKS